MTTCEQLIPLAQIIARIFTMTLVSIGAILSIYWGWHLYCITAKSAISGELQSAKFKFKFVSAGPGIVLAGFGAWLLSIVAMHPFSVEYDEQFGPTKPSASISHITQSRKKHILQISAPTGTADISAKTEPCVCKPLRIKRKYFNLDGGGVTEPSYQEMKLAVETALTKIRAEPAKSSKEVELKKNAINALEYMLEVIDSEVLNGG
jgi:hypothetical protein